MNKLYVIFLYQAEVFQLNIVAFYTVCFIGTHTCAVGIYFGKARIDADFIAITYSLISS